MRVRQAARQEALSLRDAWKLGPRVLRGGAEGTCTTLADTWTREGQHWPHTSVRPSSPCRCFSWTMATSLMWTWTS